MGATLHLIEVRHKKTGKLLFATHGMNPVEASGLAAYLSVHLPLYMMVIRDRFTNELIEVIPHERTD